MDPRRNDMTRLIATGGAFIVIATLAACSKPEPTRHVADFKPPHYETRADRRDKLDARFDAMDRNGDGVLQPDETPVLLAAKFPRTEPITEEAFVQAGLHRFDRLDVNHDGVLPPAEGGSMR